MLSDAKNRATRREWRELGFLYDRDDEMTGSRAGLVPFRDTLLAYVADPRNILKSEHEHYGPYSYLEIMTWPEAGFDNHAIRGPLGDLAQLAALIETRLATAPPGSTAGIQEAFAAIRSRPRPTGRRARSSGSMENPAPPGVRSEAVQLPKQSP
jgi:hypothetical protein